ncbi:MAG: excinuclease ABC subunit UvrC [Stomatobaculum sp.]|nr:excinuclease ABC subunit UvrC [Stomatobaculum sp.]
MFDIQEELKKLPKSPGVYIMHDKKDEILYVGKAVNLYNRVHQYFQTSRGKTTKILKMISLIDHFEYIVTDSELEALVLENNLIKENRPRYNTLLRDDKTDPYIKVTVREPYPRIFLTRKLQKDKAKYFGPFSSSSAVRDTLDLMYKVFRLRDCSRVLPKDIGKERPCLNYHIHQCGAPCQGFISEEEYRKNVDAALGFLNGKFDPVMDRIRDEMMKASDAMEFERAAELRDLLNSVDHIAQKQKITSDGMEDRDLIALARDDREAVIQVFFVREGRIVGREHHYLRTAVEEEDAELLESFVKQFYAGTPFLPREIWLRETLPDAKLLSDWLSEKRGSRVRLVVPKKGEKEKLMELAERNAAMILEKDRERLQMDVARSSGAVREIEALTGLSGISRMEAYDISNISGVESVGSMVVYEDGKPKKSDYRKFRIRTVVGPDDYASMREVLTRRLTHSLEQKDDHFLKLPDLILMDGGRGQVNIALEVLEELKLGIPVCGMVKDDRHRTRALWYRGGEVPIDQHSEGFRLITRIQDEAHRFAIEYHRSLRSKDQVRSLLDGIPGIGPVRRKALLRQFGSLEGIHAASLEELSAAPDMNAAAAASVYQFFRSYDTMNSNEKTEDPPAVKAEKEQ